MHTLQALGKLQGYSKSFGYVAIGIVGTIRGVGILDKQLAWGNVQPREHRTH